MALCFCGRHAGDQGSERADRAGPEPPGSLGAPLFNHRAAKQSDGELHMPLVSPVSFCLGLHLSRFCFPHIFSLPSRMPPLIPRPSLLISDCSPARVSTPQHEAIPPRRRRGRHREPFQKDLIVSETIAEAPDAIRPLIRMLGTTWCQVSLGFTVRWK